MENEGGQQLGVPYYCTIKVHNLMCLQLKTFVDRISLIYSDIESARPRCTTGLQALCSLHAAMDKAKLLIQHCSDSSKLYLAFTAERIVWRCEDIRKSLVLCLGQIQNMVPTLLAAKISGTIEDITVAKFTVESSEDEAGKFVKELTKLGVPVSDSFSESEFRALQLAAVRLRITSPLDVLIEKRSIKKLRDKVPKNDKKRKILDFLLYLLRKYGRLIAQNNTENDPPLREKNKIPTEDSATREPPPELKCPISERLMYDPVIIASGKTFERVWIEKWLQEGNATCPVTAKKLDNKFLIPNAGVKDIISKWCSDNGITLSEPSTQSVPAQVYLQKFSSYKSVASIGSSMDDLNFHMSNVSLQSSDTNFSVYTINEDDKNATFGVGLSRMDDAAYARNCLALLSNLDSLPWKSQCKVVQDIKEQLDKNGKDCESIYSNSSIKALIKFLTTAHDLSDAKAQNDSSDVLLSIISKARIELLAIDKNVIHKLASILDSEISEKALQIMEELSSQRYYKSSIVESGVLPSVFKLLESRIKGFRELALKIVCNLSYNNDIAYHIVYLDCIQLLVPFLGDQGLSGYCLTIMNMLCSIEEGMIGIVRTNSCISSIANLVESGTKQEQETALEVLQSLCYDHTDSCKRAIGESIIQSLFYISENENSRKKVMATELLQLLGHKTEADVSDNSLISSGHSIEDSSDSNNHPKKKKSSSRSKRFSYFGKKISRFFSII